MDDLTNKEQTPPFPNEPVVDKNGRVNRSWFYFFLQLFKKTKKADDTEVLLASGVFDSPRFYDAMLRAVEKQLWALPVLKGYEKEITDLERKLIAGIYETSEVQQSAQYETIFIPAGAMTSTATSGATYLTYEYATNDINVNFLEFDGAAEEYAEFQLPMPEQWDLGTIKAKFFWTSATGSTAGDTVEFEIQAGAISNNDTIDAALGTAQVISDTLLADNGTKLQVTDATPAITVGGSPALGDMIHFKISRNVGGTDNMTEDAWLFGCLIQFKTGKAVATW